MSLSADLYTLTVSGSLNFVICSLLLWGTLHYFRKRFPENDVSASLRRVLPLVSAYHGTVAIVWTASFFWSVGNFDQEFRMTSESAWKNVQPLVGFSIGYFLFDTIIMVWYKEWIFTLHHIASIIIWAIVLLDPGRFMGGMLVIFFLAELSNPFQQAWRLSMKHLESIEKKKTFNKIEVVVTRDRTESHEDLKVDNLKFIRWISITFTVVFSACRLVAIPTVFIFWMISGMHDPYLITVCTFLELASVYWNLLILKGLRDFLYKAT